MVTYKADFASEATKNRIQRDKDEGITLGVNSTPTFFVNGKAIQPTSYEQFKEIIETAAKSNTQ